MRPTTGGGRLKLFEAAWQHTANPRDGGLWYALAVERRAHDYQPVEAHHLRFLELYGVLFGEVEGRLASGEWTAWGWRKGDTTPVKIPIELFERSDVKIDLERCTISCAVCAFDNVTVDVSMIGIPRVIPAKTIKAEAVIGQAFNAWTDTLAEWPTQRQAKRFARDGKYLQSAVLKLHKDGLTRGRGRPAKTDND